MPRPAPATRGILRRSSYTSTDTSSCCSNDSLWANFNEDEVHFTWVREPSTSSSSPPASPPASPPVSDNDDSTSNSPITIPKGARNNGRLARRRRGGDVPLRQPPPRSASMPTTARQPPARRGVGRNISFSETLVSEEHTIPIIPPSKCDEFFYGEDEIATFRYEKFMEDCGLDPETGEEIGYY